KGKKRPCLVVSQTEFTNLTKFAWVLPITGRNQKYPTDIALQTNKNIITGIVDAAQIRALDISSRSYKVIDSLDRSVINKVKDVILSILD
ncbi:MAG: type II toxin-antitoxin system PemK/MazF family toxin, partial [Eubacteriales bacterium]|nr:type II toxin-antitoxin system PemK/MazF family toxin [Eubacteriales bacterium]